MTPRSRPTLSILNRVIRLRSSVYHGRGTRSGKATRGVPPPCEDPVAPRPVIDREALRDIPLRYLISRLKGETHHRAGLIDDERPRESACRQDGIRPPLLDRRATVLKPATPSCSWISKVVEGRAAYKRNPAAIVRPMATTKRMGRPQRPARGTEWRSWTGRYWISSMRSRRPVMGSRARRATASAVVVVSGVKSMASVQCGTQAPGA